MKYPKVILLLVALTFLSLFFQGCTQEEKVTKSKHPQILIRVDDVGMNHSVNMAAAKLSSTQIPFSASVMTPCPWFEEAVAVLSDKRHISVGVHLTLNSEWQNYRWGSVLGQTAVPSLVNDDGYFYPTTALFLENAPKPGEVRSELRAQIDKAFASGLEIEYLDYHMGTAVSTPEFTAIVEKLAHDYGLGIARYFGESYGSGIYSVAPVNKLDSLIAIVETFQPGETYLQVFHIGRNTPEMQALKDLNPNGLANVAAHRQAELDALISPDFIMALERNGIRLVNYGSLIQERGLQSMKRPADFQY